MTNLLRKRYHHARENKGTDWERGGIVTGNERSVVIVRSREANMAEIPKIQSG